MPNYDDLNAVMLISFKRGLSGNAMGDPPPGDLAVCKAWKQGYDAGWATRLRAISLFETALKQARP